MKKPPNTNSLARGVFWTSFAFYALIALEFFYMFSPFAIYFYGVYGPGLNLMSNWESTSQLIAFFMPHIVRETQSFLITWHEMAGMLFFTGGLAVFAAGAFQIYRNKLVKKGAVVQGIYRRIRHPQYLALMVSGFGMVLVWPRYLVLFGFITVCFAYFFLARMEEKICRQKFPGYGAYIRETGMFLPKNLERLLSKIPRPRGRIAGIAAAAVLYILLLACSFFAARTVHSYSVAALYTWSTDDEVMVSVGAFEQDEFRELRSVVLQNDNLANRLASYTRQNEKLIGYVMPADLFISEVPMHIPGGEGFSHQSPGSKDQSRYKIIYTLAEFGPAGPAAGGLDILRRAIHKTPVLEVWINRPSRQVEQVFDSPAPDVYDGIPVPVF